MQIGHGKRLSAKKRTALLLSDQDWKEYLEYLEMDSSFIRSISDESVWTAIEKRMKSGENVWRDLIRDFQLLNVPYATASIPSPQLMQQMEEERKQRITDKQKRSMRRFHTRSEQEALSDFEREEIAKTREIDKIAAQIQRPKFTDHPPLRRTMTCNTANFVSAACQRLLRSLTMHRPSI